MIKKIDENTQWLRINNVGTVVTNDQLNAIAEQAPIVKQLRSILKDIDREAELCENHGIRLQFIPFVRQKIAQAFKTI